MLKSGARLMLALTALSAIACTPPSAPAQAATELPTAASAGDLAPPPASDAPSPKPPPVAVIPKNAPPEPKPYPRHPLTIETSNGPVRLEVEVVDTPAGREKGLMYRRSIGPNQGMLFDFKFPQTVYFWMKNTYIPLDMLFIDATGRIVGIAENAVPLSIDPIGPGEIPVLGVLEIGGGQAVALGIHPGDVVRHRIFEP